jgi:hypothetical protein
MAVPEAYWIEAADLLDNIPGESAAQIALLLLVADSITIDTGAGPVVLSDKLRAVLAMAIGRAVEDKEDFAEAFEEMSASTLEALRAEDVLDDEDFDDEDFEEEPVPLPRATQIVDLDSYRKARKP